MVVIADYHVHTDNSLDCKTPMVEMCMKAVEIGVTEIAFTDHFNNHLLDIDLGYYKPEQFFRDIEYCRAEFPGLTIVAGVEVGEPHRWQRKIKPVLDNYPYDVVMGSLHWVGRENMFDVNYFRARAQTQAYNEYFTELLRMVEHGGFDILGHVDLPKRMGFDVYGKFEVARYEGIVRDIWRACLDNNITPEINTKSLRMPVNQTHPSLEALQWYVDMGGQRLTIGSDAHRADSLASGIRAGQHIALKAGLTHVCRFRQRMVTDWLPLVADQVAD